MKKVITLLLLAHTALFSFDIEVKITHIENTKGKMYIGLYNKAKGFRDTTKTFKKAIVPIDSKNLVQTFHNVTKGTYAISVFHDENNNGKLDTNLLGIPKENYGFSHNVKHLMRAANFNEAKFVLNKNAKFIINIGE